MFGLQDTLKYWANEGAQNRGKVGGSYNINPLERLMGANVEDIKNIENRELQESLNEQFGTQGALAGVSGADWGESKKDYVARVNAGQEKKKKAVRREETDYQNANFPNTPAGRQLQLQVTQQEASNKLLSDKLLEQTRQFDVTQAGNRADRISARADKADDRIAQLELAEMQLAAEDRRATERWDREDKKERAALIAQLFSGLGQTAQFI